MSLFLWLIFLPFMVILLYHYQIFYQVKYTIYGVIHRRKYYILYLKVLFPGVAPQGYF